MKRKFRKAAQLALMLVFLVSTTLLVRQWLDDSGGEKSYEGALALATSGGKSAAAEQVPEETKKAQWIPAPVEEDIHIAALAEMDLEALRSVNPDVVGWIRIPDTRIDYPLMQGEDNDFYLGHTWEGEENSVGSIFLEHQIQADLTDFNTIVYGHNMKNGAMFASLKNYAAEWYWEKHPYVYILSDAGVYRYEVFSSYQADVDSVTYGISFHQGKTRADFLTHALENSDIDTGIQPELTDRILTLSTCSGAGYAKRRVVQARLKMVPAE